MFDTLMRYAQKPTLYEESTSPFWDDEHISKGMLKAHLDPALEAASRRHDFIDRSAAWIAQIAPPGQYKQLLDLGCGPGLYAQRFSKAGYAVTGIDFSRRSLAYAKEQAALHGSPIDYRYQNYLTMDFDQQFDVIALIYCDYAPFSYKDRMILLGKVYSALKPGGKFIFDVFTPKMRHAESHTWYLAEQGGFYSAKPHVCLESFYQYDDADRTELRQAIVIAEEGVNRYHIWDHFFDREALLAEVEPMGFRACEVYGNVAGDAFSEDSETICCVATK